jgi:hypothetical protein
VDRFCPVTRQAKRSLTFIVLIRWCTAARRRSGLRGFPGNLLLLPLLLGREQDWAVGRLSDPIGRTTARKRRSTASSTASVFSCSPTTTDAARRADWKSDRSRQRERFCSGSEAAR